MLRTAAGFVAVLLLLSMAPVATAGDDADRGMVLWSEEGPRKIDAKERAVYIQTAEYLEARMREIETVRPGTQYREIKEHFRRDGGLSMPPPHRFVNVLCPHIKLHISFKGEKVGEPFREIPDGAIVESVSPPFLEAPQHD